MSTLRMISLRLTDLFNLFDESIQQIPDEHKGPVLASFCRVMKRDHKVAQAEIDEGVRMLLMKEDCKKGFVGPGGTVRRKEASENGLAWRDANRQ